MTPIDQDADTLSSLEDRIQHAIDLVSRLRKEKESALEEAAETRAANLRLAEEVKTLQAERKQVRSRIEKLLGQIDQLSA